MTISWNITPDVAWGQLAERQVDAIEADIVALVESMLDEVTSWMKENARWNDVTGNARAGLFSDMQHITRQAVYLLMSHDVTLDYTWALEASPRTSLLGDAADHWWPVLYRGAVEIVRKHSS